MYCKVKNSRFRIPDQFHVSIRCTSEIVHVSLPDSRVIGSDRKRVQRNRQPLVGAEVLTPVRCTRAHTHKHDPYTRAAPKGQPPTPPWLCRWFRVRGARGRATTAKHACRLRVGIPDVQTQRARIDCRAV